MRQVHSMHYVTVSLKLCGADFGFHKASQVQSWQLTGSRSHRQEAAALPDQRGGGQPVGISVCFAHVTQIANITFSVSQTETRGCTFKVKRWEILCCEGNFLGSLPLWPLMVPSSVTFPEPSPPEQDSEVIRHIIQ